MCRCALVLFALGVVCLTSLPPAEASGSAARLPHLAYAVSSGNPNGNGIVFLANADGSNPRRYGRGGNPLLSTDGTLIAYAARNASQAQIVVIRSTHGSTRTQVGIPRRATFLGFVGHDVVISDDDGLLLRGVTDARWRTLVPARLDGDRFPALASSSPSGTDVAIVAESRTASDLYVVHVAGGQIRKLTSDGQVRAATWGPHGIAYSDGGIDSDIWMIQPDGSDAHQVTHTGAGIDPVAFDASGDHLVAANPAMHNGRLWAVDVPSGRARALTGWVGDLYAQGISRDGRTIFASIGCGGMPVWNGHLESFPFAGGRPRVFSDGACRGSWVA